MADLNLDNLGNKDYFYDYIKEETDKISDISENKLINIVKYMFYHFFFVHIFTINVSFFTNIFNNI